MTDGKEEDPDQKNGQIRLEDLEPGALSPSRASAGPAGRAARARVADEAVTARSSGGGASSRERLEFSALPTSDLIPGQANDEAEEDDDEEEDDDDDAKSLANDSFTTAASTLSLGDICKICHCGSEVNMPLIAPCFCAGSLKYVHQDCLQRWIKSSDIRRCELCKYQFTMESKVKPFCQWEKLDMTSLERRKLFCSVTFHVVAITCVVWSLYVLIDRTAEEIKSGDLQWPFWTKLVVVAIGFTGGLVFMYIQCKVYVHLCKKWKAYNRIIVVQDAPPGLHKVSPDRPPQLLAAAVVKSPSSASPAGPAANSGNQDGASTSGQQTSAPSSSMTTTTTTTKPPATTSSTTKTNAETQTALRGVAKLQVAEAPEGGGGESDPEKGTLEDGSKDVAVITKILEDKKTAAIFFTECECPDIQNSEEAPQQQQDTKASSISVSRL